MCGVGCGCYDDGEGLVLSHFKPMSDVVCWL